MRTTIQKITTKVENNLTVVNIWLDYDVFSQRIISFTYLEYKRLKSDTI